MDKPVANWSIFKAEAGDMRWLYLSNRESFGRFMLAEDCSTYWTIHNHRDFPWRILPVPEG